MEQQIEQGQERLDRRAQRGVRAEQRSRTGRVRRVGLWRGLALALAGALVLSAASPALADEYDPDKAGHPLRILAYVVHPIGVAIDYLIMRPAHWLVSHEPMATVFGHED